MLVVCYRHARFPQGSYRFHFNDRPYYFVSCEGYTFRYEWTVAVTAPEGTLHEAFFDPVTDGSVVAADSTNGVLNPAEFTDANGTSATINRIAWEAGTGESGTVKLKLSPHNGIAGHTLHFIALDGSVPLSLKVADATVDGANDTLSWTVASQPWHERRQADAAHPLGPGLFDGCGGKARRQPGSREGLPEEGKLTLIRRSATMRLVSSGRRQR